MDVRPNLRQKLRVAEKRRLTVLQPPPDEDVPARPAWQWSLFGAGLIALTWLLLALLTSPVASFILRRSLGPWGSPDELARLMSAAGPDVAGRLALENLALQVLIVGLASAAGGAVVGRWGPGRGVGPAAAAGATVAGVAVALAALTSRGPNDDASNVAHVVTWGFLILVPWASATAAAGAWRSGRTKGTLPR